jgi:hypothetical protein
MKGNFIAQLGGFNEHYKIAADWDLMARAINLSKPKVWTYSLARFELGGESSKRLLEAHLELKMIRDKYLVRSLKHQILDDLWCATYLQYFGYKNYFTPIINFFGQKMRLKKKKLEDRHIRDKSRGFHLNFGILLVYIVKKMEIENPLRRLKKSLIKNYIFWLHNKLHIEPYSALPPAHRVRK